MKGNLLNEDEKLDLVKARFSDIDENENENEKVDGETFFDDLDNHITLDLTNLSGEEVREKLRKYGYELPKYFNFEKYVSITFCTKTKTVVEVEKY